MVAVNTIKAIHVYDFDNTRREPWKFKHSSSLTALVFISPLPNQQLWSPSCVGFLQTQECFVNGGWWHDQHILEATGEGIDKEEAKGWEGWWNEQIVRGRSLRRGND